MVKGIGEVEPAGQTLHGLFQGRSGSNGEGRVYEKVFIDLLHPFRGEAVIAAQNPLQLQSHRFGQKQHLARLD